MSVDGIGGGGRRPPIGGPPGGPTSVEGKAPAGRVSGQAEAAPAHSAGEVRPLERLARGEIDLDGYLDGRVAEATRHLEGRLPVAELDFIRETLRAELTTDPVLIELVRRTTGSVPTPAR